MNESVEVYWTEDGDPASQAPPTTGPIATVTKQGTVVLPLREAHLGQFFLRPKIEGYGLYSTNFTVVSFPCLMYAWVHQFVLSRCKSFGAVSRLTLNGLLYSGRTFCQRKW